jgi:tetratricopeptide (TPR) repeat protein
LKRSICLALLGGLAAAIPAAGQDRFAFATLENGLSVGFALVRTAGPESATSIADVALVRSNFVSRVLVDRESGAFFGYRLSAERAAAGRVRIAFQALPSDIEVDLRRKPPCADCPPPTRLDAATPRFPATQVLGDGEALSLELLANPATGERIFDVVKVSFQPVTGESLRPAVERTLEAWRIGGRAAVFVARKDHKGALAEYQKALALTPRDAGLHNRMGICYQHMDREKAARQEYEQALALNPRYAEVWNNLGTLEQGARRLGPAVRAYRKALEIKPSMATAWKNLGSAYLSQAKVAEGLAAYRRAYELDPTVLESRAGAVTSGIEASTLDYYLAKMFAANGQAEMALEFLLKAEAEGFRDWSKVERDPDFDLLAADPRFQQLLRDDSSH